MPVTDNCREHGTFQPHITNKSLNIREWISVSLSACGSWMRSSSTRYLSSSTSSLVTGTRGYAQFTSNSIRQIHHHVPQN